MNKHSRLLAPSCGALIGDTPGAHVEFKPRADCAHDPITDIRAYGTRAELSHFSPLLNVDLVPQTEPNIQVIKHFLKAVHPGEDTDTTGCVAGGLAGVLHGIESIPQEWLDALPRQDDLRELFDRFIKTAANQPRSSTRL